MSANPVPRLRSTPAFGSRATSSNLGWYLLVFSLLVFAAAEFSYAEQLGVELLSTTMATTIAEEQRTAADPAEQLPASDIAIDEIVVFGVRGEDGTVRPRRLLNDPLLQHILKDFETRQALEQEFAWRLASAYLDEARPQTRVGYDLREESREPERKPALDLPMELIRPAIVISVDF